MKTEKGVIIVAYKESDRNPRFTVLKRKKNWEGWELPKGHLEKDDYRETVKIELGEETGIEQQSIESITDLEQLVEWEFEEDGQTIGREYKAFLVKLSEDSYIDVSKNPCDEHETGLFLRFRDVEEMLTYDDQTELLRTAYNKITQE